MNTAGRFIYTHNNADFDAIAALLGMFLLDTAARPVLPKRMRRNVRNFLTLYAKLLPAIPYDEAESIVKTETVYLVDTQSYYRIPHLQDDTPVYIVDHHPIHHDFPAHFTLKVEQLGATATLIVEMLQQQSVIPAPLEATLLMLGIYEDCGSLTYGTTTVRDIRAAAWLLERGADMDVLREFLRYPLQDEHWQIVDALRETTEIIDIRGHTVLMATASLKQQIEGVSRVAHHLMNLYDPTALLMLVKMENDVQLVARSTLDEIDVGLLARKFGGGGHTRAAAALVRNAALHDVQARLKAHLADAVAPSVTVADLMSAGRIETIDYGASIADAAHRMHISGHEGYPVLHNGRLMGLLTRRAVDRAMNHQLGQQPVHQIMEASTTAYVYPTDSLEMLRQKMMDMGWGQMPVLNHDGDLLGIVTRTDLIRRWGVPLHADAQRRTVAEKLRQMLPDGLWPLLEAISRHANQQEIDLYLVGGLVRDLLLDTLNLDLDLVVEGDAIAFAESLSTLYGGALRVHRQFGTAKWRLEAIVADNVGGTYSDAWPASIDFATARAEFYKEPTVLPTVRQSSIKQDLHRRDFTINSMALRLAPGPLGTLIDYYNGQRDIEQGLVRVLHSLSFVDDPTRMIRAVRFEQRFGFRIEQRTADLLQDALPFLERVTGERLKNELWHLLKERYPVRAFFRLQELQIMQQLSPVFQVDVWFSNAFRAMQYAVARPLWREKDIDQQLAGFALLVLRRNPDDIETVSRRFMLARSDIQTIQHTATVYRWLLQHHQAPPSQIVERLSVLEPTGWVALWAALPDAHLRRHVVAFITRWRYVDTTIDGHQLKAMGVQPGPQMGQILRQMRAAWLDGIIVDQHTEAHYLQRLLETLDA